MTSDDLATTIVQALHDAGWYAVLSDRAIAIVREQIEKENQRIADSLVHHELVKRIAEKAFASGYIVRPGNFARFKAMLREELELKKIEIAGGYLWVYWMNYYGN